jgi:hypothetical protein
MRLGCTGCLGAVLAALLLAAAVVGIVLGLVRATEAPDIALPVTTAADGLRAQQKLFEIVRGRGASGEIVLTEAELNAFLSRHLADAAELPLTGLGIRLVGRDRVEFAGRLPSRHLARELPLASLWDLLPVRWADRPAWLSLRARVGTEPGVSREQRRYLRLDVERFALGRQRLPAILVRLMFSPATLRVLRWQLPETVESVAAEPGRVVIRVTTSR